MTKSSNVLDYILAKRHRKGDYRMSKIIIPESCYPEVAVTVTRWVDTYFGPTLSYDDSLQASINQWGLPWFRAGAIVRNAEGKILMMHEGRVQIKKIKDEVLKNQLLSAGRKPSEWVDGDGGWNLPSGRLKPGESFEDGVQREIKEKSGWDIAIKDCLHIRQSNKPSNMYILPVYLAEAIAGPERYKTAETSEIGWFLESEILGMCDKGLLRSPEFVTESINSYKGYLEAH